jgi:hypothetical protein
MGMSELKSRISHFTFHISHSTFHILNSNFHTPHSRFHIPQSWVLAAHSINGFSEELSSHQVLPVPILNTDSFQCLFSTLIAV